MTVPINNDSRLHYLDSARAFALILGIVFHASISFMPIFIGWAVMDVSTSAAIPVFMLVSHSFRLALFFLIAGYFSRMSYYQNGGANFFKSRLVRIALPFLLGWFLLRPLLVSAWVMGGESLRGDVNILDGLKSGVATLSWLPDGIFTGTHLWFLYYLLLVTICVFMIRFLIRFNKRIEGYFIQRSDALFCWVCKNSNITLLVAAIPTAAALWFMSYWGIDTPDKSLIPDIPVLFIYGGFYLFGWLLHKHRSCLDSFVRISGFKIFLGLCAIVSSVFISRFESKTGFVYYGLLKTCFTLSYAVMMWSMVSLTMGLFKWFLDRPSKLVRYIADSSYWLYLVHLPIVVFLQVAFAELPIHWSLKLAIISGVTILISLLLYDMFIRSTFVGAILNGKRKARASFGW